MFTVCRRSTRSTKVPSPASMSLLSDHHHHHYHHHSAVFYFSDQHRQQRQGADVLAPVSDVPHLPRLPFLIFTSPFVSSPPSYSPIPNYCRGCWWRGCCCCWNWCCAAGLRPVSERCSSPGFASCVNVHTTQDDVLRAFPQPLPELTFVLRPAPAFWHWRSCAHLYY